MRIMDGNVALVTGAASGIGRRSALTFAREGAKVVVADWNPQGGSETVRLIEESGGQAIGVGVDVSKAREVESLIQEIMRTYSRLDFAHNNAGVESKMLPIADSSEENWDRVLAINLKSVWLCLKYEIPAMIAQGRGSIVNTSSVLGIIGAKNVAPYVASKHGVVGLTKAAALEYADFGIRVNAVCPSITNTPMVRRVRGGAEVPLEHTANYPIKRLVDPQEVAEAVVWLCSDRASYLNGHSLVIDGGLSVQ
jgi:NAD(P)-dependent dehydrogenase (short-subunit alcohol dehydrogenase family)